MEPLGGLEEALADEIRLERDLLAVSARKRDALVALDLGGVEEATSREQDLLVELGGAAERRMRRTADAARLLGLPEAEAGVTRVAGRAGEPVASRLLARAAEFRRTLDEVSRLNRTNRRLTEQSIAHVKEFFLALSGAGHEVTYTRRGLEARPEAPRIMIDQVV